MAITREELLTALQNGAVWNTGVTFERTNPVPIEKYSIFENYEKALEYATTSPVAYPGQLLAVLNASGSVTFYGIESDGSLNALAADFDIADFVDNTTLVVNGDTISIYGFTGASENALPVKAKNADGKNVLSWVTIDKLVNDTNTVTDGDEKSIETTTSTDGTKKTLSVKGYTAATVGNVPFKSETGINWNPVYTKEETLNEISKAIGQVSHFTAQVVNSIDEVTKTDVFYLIKKTDIEGVDNYEEYLLIGGIPTKIGETTLDLSNYVTSNTLTETLKSYAKTSVTDGLDSRLSTVEGKVSTAEADISNIKNLIGTGDESDDSILDRLTLVEGDISDLKETVNTDHEDRIAELEELVGDDNSGLVKDNAANKLAIEGLRQSVQDLGNTYATDLELAGVKNELNAVIEKKDNIEDVNEKIATAKEEAISAASDATDLAIGDAIGKVADTVESTTVSDDNSVYENVNIIKKSLSDATAKVADDLSKTNTALDNHTKDTTAHITAAERTQWNAAQANVIESITSSTLKVSSISNKSVSIDIEWGSF